MGATGVALGEFEAVAQSGIKPGAARAVPAVEIRDMSLVYQGADQPVTALQDINLTIERGAFVSFIGPSGCGKTTLMRAVADLEHPTSGSLLVNGVTPSAARLDRAYGYVFQAPALYPWRRIEANVRLPLEVMGFDKAEHAERARRYIKLVGLEGFERKFPWQLSGGMQQRASIARALCFEPELLLMDEPFGALDEITRDRLNEELLRLWRTTRKTVIFVTHSIAEAAFLSSKIVVMSARPGRVVKIIDNDAPADRKLDWRESPQFLDIAHQLREALNEGHAHDV
jgi:NitT/TauT family transport system ATP-binding protein